MPCPNYRSESKEDHKLHNSRSRKPTVAATL